MTPGRVGAHGEEAVQRFHKRLHKGRWQRARVGAARHQRPRAQRRLEVAARLSQPEARERAQRGDAAAVIAARRRKGACAVG